MSYHRSFSFGNGYHELACDTFESLKKCMFENDLRGISKINNNVENIRTIYITKSFDNGCSCGLFCSEYLLGNVIGAVTKKVTTFSGDFVDLKTIEFLIKLNLIKDTHVYIIGRCMGYCSFNEQGKQYIIGLAKLFDKNALKSFKENGESLLDCAKYFRQDGIVEYLTSIENS